MTAYLPDADPLLILSVVLVTGVAFGELARLVKLPSITGQILAGALIGEMGFEVFALESVQGLHPLTHFALGLVAVTVGAHLNVRKLRNAARRLLFLLALESILVPAFVFVGISLVSDTDWSVALLFGAMAISTAPATVVALVKETRSKGVFVKTLIAAVALNNMACIVLFELARLAARERLMVTKLGASEVLMGAFTQLAQAAVVGVVAAILMAVFTRFVPQVEKFATAGFITILLTAGMASHLGYSSLMACLVLGLTQTNVVRERDKVVDTVFSSFEPAIFAAFFTLAGMELSLEHAGFAGLMAAVLFLTRAAGKLAAARIAMRLAGATSRLRENLGMALIPQAGVAVGLVVVLEEDPVFRVAAEPVLELVAAVVLTAVVINEVVGPILTRVALVRSGEANRDRMRLIDFIHEENIVLDHPAQTMEQAIDDLTSLLIQSHHLSQDRREPLLKSALEREKESSTCLGGGLAVPHGELPAGTPIAGVMAINRRGYPFEGPDGEPVRCIVLLATPQDHRERHLQILAALARTIGSDPQIQMQLYHAKTPAHVYEVLHSEEAEDFNYFLEDLA